MTSEELAVLLPPQWEQPGVCAFEQVQESLLDCRAKVRIPEGAASILCFVFPYRAELPKGNLSRYAVPPDYHGIVVPALERLALELEQRFPPWRFSAFCDNSPIPEVRAAALSGLGVRGENGLLIHPRFGSWVFLGEIVTDCLIEPTGREVFSCIGCGACGKACPGGALGACFARERCLSHITQKKGELTQQEASLLQAGGLAWGCDRCQECCPMNRESDSTNLTEFSTDCRVNVEKESPAGKDRAYSWRGPTVVLRNLELLNQ